MSVLILKNASHEGPGTIESFLADNKISFKIVECSREDIPSSSEFDTLVMMGGPMSVNETDIYPYIGKEIQLASEFMKSGRKVLGICLGAQIMAKSLGSKIYPGKEKEIGWYEIELGNGGKSDRLMRVLASDPASGKQRDVFPVFHWHGETFDVPSGAAHLAESELYPNQAFRYGDSSYAFQFHIEVTKEMIYDWLKNEAVNMDLIFRQTDALHSEYTARAANFYKAFFC
ncbi:MAG: type 1 glutamine amidotransferase [Nitrospirae bacterium]|nr:type 1 glutamine amidotransferase [Nitrospirota bacterium]